MPNRFSTYDLSHRLATGVQNHKAEPYHSEPGSLERFHAVVIYDLGRWGRS